MTFNIQEHSPQYNSPEEDIRVLGSGSKEQCIEILRKHFLDCNQRLIDLTETMTVPDCILNLARDSVERNSDLDIVVRDDGIVFVDGNGPEMDYYTIREVTNNE